MSRAGQPWAPEEVAIMVEAASRAPSIHNTQPWRFSAVGETVEVWTDRRRSLAVADPQGREMLISCGAAVFNLRLAVAHLGFEPITRIVADGDHVASVSRGPARDADPVERRLYAAVPQRHTHRRPFARNRLGVAELNRLEAACLAEGAWLHSLHDTSERRQVGALIERAVRHDAADPAYLEELARWMRYEYGAGDGIPARARGSAPYPVDGLPQAGLATAGYLTAALADELAHSTFLVLGTGGDAPAERVRAGMALERLLLEATALGMVVSFANQVLELPDLRDALADAIGATGHAQLLFRVGHPLAGVPATPRRDLSDLFPYS